MRKLLILLIFLMVFTGCIGCTGKEGPENNPGGEKISAGEEDGLDKFAFNTKYFDTVIGPSGISKEDIYEETKEFYFEWKERYLYTVPDTNPVQKYVYYTLEDDSHNNKVVSCSEGHGYGMIIAALMAEFDSDSQKDFDAMFNFFKTHKSISNPNLMAWQQVKNSKGEIINTRGDENSAADGDMDIAYALLMAHNNWGSDGEINYREEALKCIKAIMESDVNKTLWTLKLGDWVEDDDKKYGGGTRASDFMPGYLKVFSYYDKENQENWMKLFDKTVDISNKMIEKYSPKTGLLPDFISVKPDNTYAAAPSNYLESKYDGDYYYNSCRTPLRLSLDYILTGDMSVKKSLDTLNQFMRTDCNGDPRRINAGYYVSSRENGNRIREGESDRLCFLAPLAVSAMIDKSNQEWLDSLWRYMANEYSIEESDYFGNTLKMMSMIIISGR